MELYTLLRYLHLSQTEQQSQTQSQSHIKLDGITLLNNYNFKCYDLMLTVVLYTVENRDFVKGKTTA